MAESGYVYRVLALTRHGVFADLGEHRGRTPDAAIELAVEENGMPDEPGGVAAAVAGRHWNERHARKRMVPEWTIEPMEGESGGVHPDLPPPAGDDLAPGIDPEHACERVEDGQPCEHLPGEHGAKGLGMCRAKGCPCGGYEPQPEPESS